MKITLVQTGKSHFGFVNDGFKMYADRLSHYCKFNYIEVVLGSKQKTTDTDLIKKYEAELQLKMLKTNDVLILLDNKGKEHNSTDFSKQLEKWITQSHDIYFLVGGSYGFDENVYKRANAKISLSKLTFSHQLVKLIFVEQLYRAFSIIKGLPYHHE